MTDHELEVHINDLIKNLDNRQLRIAKYLLDRLHYLRFKYNLDKLGLEKQANLPLGRDADTPAEE
jgi:hypothetical protein